MTARVQPIAKVEQFGTYHLVTFGDDGDEQYQVTVDNAGMVKLPQLVTPAQVPLLIGALEAAHPVAVKQQKDNHEAQQQMNDFFAQQRAATQDLEKRAAAKAARQRKDVQMVKSPRASAPRTQSARAVSKVGRPRNAGSERLESGPVTPQKAARNARKPAKKATPKPTPKARKRSG
jgi:hypothetical protein